MFFIAVIILFALIYYLDKRRREQFSELPGPPTLPFIGNAHSCFGSSADFFEIFNECWQIYGTRIRVIMGSRLVLLLSDPKDIEVVMTNPEFLNKAPEYRFLHPWLGTGLTTSTGEKWKIYRKILTPAFHFKILENFIDIFELQTSILIDKLRKFTNGDSFNVYNMMTMYTLDIISETAMGVSINAQRDTDSEYVGAVKVMCEIINERVRNPFKMPDLLFALTNDYQRQKSALKILHGFTNKMIKERRQLLEEKKETLSSYTNEIVDNYGRKKKMAFLDLLLLSTINNEPLPDVSIREEVDTFLSGGYDTTASALSFALYLISKHPHVQQKLFEEQQSIFGDDMGKKANYSDLQDMKYMELTLKEVLRLYPSGPMIGRETSKDTYVNDLFLPAKTTISIMIYNMNHNPEIFPHPDEFIPERFLPEECKKRNPFSTISFSAGQRNCIGQKYAMLEMKSCLSYVLRSYELLPAKQYLRLRADNILKPVDGIFIKIKPRI